MQVTCTLFRSPDDKDDPWEGRQPELVDAFRDICSEMRRRREAGEFRQTARPRTEGREDYDNWKLGLDWAR